MNFPFFPRGEGPLVSVLIPTRGRPSHLAQAVDSIYSLAANQGEIELVLKVDDDDSETQATVGKLEEILPLKKIVSPRGRGYFDMHSWVNEMAALATGDWVFLFNDDARMASERWDYNLYCVGTDRPWVGMNDAALVLAPTKERPHAQEFFFLRRKTFELLGHVSLSPHNDNWIWGVMDFCGAALISPNVEVEHYSHTIGDKTREESEAAYKTTIHTLTSTKARRLRLADMGKIVGHFEKAEARMVWNRAPLRGGWHWFEPEGGGRLHVLHEDGNVHHFEGGKVLKVEKAEDLKGLWCLRE